MLQTAADFCVAQLREFFGWHKDTVSSNGKQWAHCLIASRISAEKTLGAGAVAALKMVAGSFFSPLHRGFHLADSLYRFAICKCTYENASRCPSGGGKRRRCCPNHHTSRSDH